uniref:Uncharacterized protein n=1 Tax=Amphimedon queenslandica TaxID=400682 RepID=A0A1X7UCX3_AMPQE
ELYSVTHEDVIQHVLDLLVEKDHIDSVFSKDFIFYFCFANILHCFYSLQAYPESLKLLVYKCVTKLKEIKPTDIARYQQEFIDKGSFKIYDSHVTEINVFHLAAKSFITHFLSKELSESDIESFSNGLKAMSYILRDLPSLMLTWENMSTVFTAKFRSIKTLWKFIVECNEYLTRDPTGVTFVKMFFHPVTIYNEKHFTKWDDEGPVMLENIVDLIRKKEWDFHNFLPILNLWLAIFVKSIDLTHPECKEHIEILFQKSKLWSSYDTCLNEKLQQLFVEKCSKLSIDRFSDLILLGHFDKVEIYKTFLNSLSYSVKQENSIMHLLCLASKYFIEQDDPQEIFLLFFYNIGSYYVKSKRSFEFIKKILEAKIFMTESYFDGEFGKKFKNFIIDSKLQKEIYNKIFSAFDKVVVHDGAFQYEVIKVLLQ